MNDDQPKLLTTKQLRSITGLSRSYFEKARMVGHGPPFFRVQSSKRCGKILYRRTDVENWLEQQKCNPEGQTND